MKDLTTISACEARQRMADGGLSATEYTRACLEKIERDDPTLQAFAFIDSETALRQAAVLDSRKQSGKPLGALHGLPVAIKDIIDTADFPTECGSPALAGRRPARDAVIVERLRDAGAIIIGKTVSTEFAFYHPGPTRNPRVTARTPGGSSSGSAAAVAANMVPLAVGTQTNGSVIRPAAYCGVVGAIPGHDAVDRKGILTLSAYFDQIGALGRTMDDVAMLMDVITTAEIGTGATPFGRETVKTGSDLSAFRVAVIIPSNWSIAAASATASFSSLMTRLGVPLELTLADEFSAFPDIHKTIMSADMARLHGEFISRSGAKTSAALRDYISWGSRVSDRTYNSAISTAQLLRRRIEADFVGFDALLTLAAPDVAPLGIETTGDPSFCTLWTLLGVPAVTLPFADETNSMRLGLQIIAPCGGQARLFAVARAIEDRLSPGQ